MESKQERSCRTCKDNNKLGCGFIECKSNDYSKWQPKESVGCKTCKDSFENQRVENTNKLLDKLAERESVDKNTLESIADSMEKGGDWNPVDVGGNRLYSREFIQQMIEPIIMLRKKKESVDKKEPEVEITCNNCTRYGDSSQQDRCIGCNSGSEFILKDLIGKKEPNLEGESVRDILKFINCKWCNNHIQGCCRNECSDVTYNMPKWESRIRAIIAKEIRDMKFDDDFYVNEIADKILAKGE